jgi:hypothetical protein
MEVTDPFLVNPDKATEEQNERLVKLKWMHLAACIFFLVQTIAYSAVPASARVNPSLGKTADCGEGASCDSPIQLTTIQHLGEVNCIFLIPLFVGLACFDHLCSFLVCHFRESTARRWLFEIGSNPFRWLEYSLSASLMAVAISILVDVSDVHLWLLIFTGHAVGMGFGQLIELLPKEEHTEQSGPHHHIRFQTLRHLGWWLGSLSIFTPWLVLACYFFRAISADVPDFVYAAFLGTFVLFCTFGLNAYLHNVLGLYDFATAEYIYIILSFTAKTFLAADVFGGLNASSN